MFSNILRKVTGITNRNIKNATELKTQLKNTKLPTNYKLMSLDVKSLFTNIPNLLVYKAIKEKWRDISRHTSIPLETFLEGIKLVLENNFFYFQW